MCLVNPELDPERIKLIISAALKASTQQDVDAVINELRQSVKSEFVKGVVEHIKKNIDDEKSAALYAAAKGYLYMAYLSTVIERAVEEITSSRYSAGWYYPRVECCVAINLIKSMWMNFIATTDIPLKDAAKAWIAAVTYEPPCRVPYTAIMALRNMHSYIMALALDASL